jgi:DNA repair exonuclease SbcCD ATPase subunit
LSLTHTDGGTHTAVADAERVAQARLATVMAEQQAELARVRADAQASTAAAVAAATAATAATAAAAAPQQSAPVPQLAPAPALSEPSDAVVAGLRRQVVQLEALLATSEHAMTAVRDAHRAAANEHADRAARLVRLREELVARQERIHTHERQLDHVRDQLRVREADLARKEALIAGHKRTLDDHQARVETTLQDKMAAVQRRADALAAQETRMDATRAQLEAAEIERRTLGTVLAEQEQRLAAIRQTLEQRGAGPSQ